MQFEDGNQLISKKQLSMPFARVCRNEWDHICILRRAV